MNWKELSLKILKIIIFILSTLAFIFVMRAAGWKGIVGFLLGMLIMAYLILSKNAMMSGIIELTKSKDYVDMINEEETEKEKDKIRESKPENPPII